MTITGDAIEIRALLQTTLNRTEWFDDTKA
jgi:hypothetical protein